MKAIEVTGLIDEQGKLHLDEPLSNLGAGPVRVILLIPEANDDMEEREWLRAAVSNTAFDFLKDPEEDVYTSEDGKHFDKEKMLNALDEIHGIWKDNTLIQDAFKELDEGWQKWRRQVEEH